MGMEVLTVSGNGGAAAVWRDIAARLSYHACNWRTAVAVNGFLFWRVAKHLPEPPWGLIHLSLADETFGITRLPDSVDPVLPEAFTLDELHGQLCMTDFSHAQTVTIWTLAVQEDGGPRPMLGEALRRPARRFLPSVGISSRWTNIMVSLAFQISIYDMATAKLTTECQMDRLKYEGRRARTWKNLFYFNVRPYTESLVRITVPTREHSAAAMYMCHATH